jgi:hypothetical protein
MRRVAALFRNRSQSMLTNVCAASSTPAPFARFGNEAGAYRRRMTIRSYLMRKTLIALATAGALVSSVAAAGTMAGQQRSHDFDSGIVGVQYDRWDDRAANINEREGRISERIQRGQRDGRVTDREARRLYRELADIEAKERAFRSDGRISGREQFELNDDLDRLAQNVRQQMRDEQRRY